MDEVKTKFDEILKQYSNCTETNLSRPKKLSFEYLNDSLETASVPKKRKFSDIKRESQPQAHINDSSKEDEQSSSSDKHNCSVKSNESLNSSSVLASPWEARRLKADLMEAKSVIIKLKKEIEQQNNLRAYSEEMYNNKVDALIKQCNFSSNKVMDMEKHLTAVRKREKEVKTELVTAQNQLIQQKQMYEEKLYNLQKQYTEYEDNSRMLQNCLQNELGDIKRQNERFRMEFDLMRQENETLKIRNQELLEKASSYDRLKGAFDLEQNAHERAKTRIKELEYEIASYGEMNEMKNTHERLMSLSDVEKEVQRLRQENKNLKDSIGNKLLLEEQVYDLRSRLERYEKVSGETVSLKVKINNLEEELNEWKKLAEDHCPRNSVLSPISLRSRIEQLLQKDVILTSEKGITKSERESFHTKIRELQTQNELCTKANANLNSNINRHKEMELRIKKRLMIVVKERNLYKQLVENLEKDLTISGAMMEAINPPDSQLKARLDILEKSLISYKEICSNLEKELESVKLLPDTPFEWPADTNSYESLKKEIETLRLENDRIRRRKEELELEMEQRCLKGDFNSDRFKVLHMAKNPADEASERHQNEIEKLQAEIERLKKKIRMLEDGRNEVSRLNETTNNMTMNLKELNTLRSKAESLENKMQHMKEVYKSASLEFREVCYMLFGYRIDRVGSANYRISSMYAETENEYLNFRLNESGVLDMLETEYSVSLGDMVRQHLAVHRSLPAFLSTLTLELFNRTTIIV